MSRIGIDCHDFESIPRWGIGRHIEYILKTIAANEEFHTGNEFFLYFKNQIPPEEYLNRPFFHKRVLKSLKPSFTLYYNWLLPRRVKKDKLDSMFYPANMLPFLHPSSVKSIVHVPFDVFWQIEQGNMALRHKWGYKVLSGNAIKRGNIITTNSIYSKGKLVEMTNANPKKIVVNPLGIDAEKFFYDPTVIKANYILNVGQAFPRRRAKEIMDGFRLLLKENPQMRAQKLRLIIVGRDKYRPPILNGIIHTTNLNLGYDAIIRLDFVNEQELVELYQKAKLLVYLSSAEAQGLPPLEALACGTVPIVRDNELTKEIFGSNCFLVADEKDPKMIKEGLLEALTDKKRYYKIVDNRNSVLKKFSWEEHVKKLLESLTFAN